MIDLNLKHRFDGFELDIQFQGAARDITAVFGRSGTGKTSIINAIAGLLPLDSGHIRIGDHVLFDSERGIDIPAHQRHVGYVFQDGRLFPHINVRGNLLYGARSRQDRAAPFTLEDITKLLEISSLLERKPAFLSGGEKQRVAIGRALLSHPRILLMDEPLASLDSQLKADILPFIERVRDELSVPVLYVSHAIDEVIRLADHMVLVSAGKVAAEGRVEEIMSRLDLQPLTGPADAGAVIPVTYAGYDKSFELAELNFDGGTIKVADLQAPVGTRLRAHIRARDVSLMLARPENTSVLNIFHGTIIEIRDVPGPQMDFLIDTGTPLVARVTRKSAHDLGLKVGQQVYALVKAVAIDRRSLGGSENVNASS